MIHPHPVPAVGPRVQRRQAALPCASIDSVLTRRA
jgi:hypothetical protein